MVCWLQGKSGTMEELGRGKLLNAWWLGSTGKKGRRWEQEHTLLSPAPIGPFPPIRLHPNGTFSYEVMSGLIHYKYSTPKIQSPSKKPISEHKRLLRDMLDLNHNLFFFLDSHLDLPRASEGPGALPVDRL